MILWILFQNLIAVTLLMLAGWVISLIFRNVTVVDTLWGMGFVLVAWLTFGMADGYPGRQLLLAGLTTLWGVRLAVYLTWRNWGKGEDPRYASWRKESGDKFQRVSLYKVFLLQAIFLWAISLSLQFGQTAAQPDRFTFMDGMGLFVWCIGFIFEAVGDWQLARFKADPANKGRVMRNGLWAYTRHPNYFGESLIWWGVFLITLSTPYSFWTIISPVIITAVLLKMTGIPLTERTIMEKRPEYCDYMETTNAFFPWFPRS